MKLTEQQINILNKGYEAIEHIKSLHNMKQAWGKVLRQAGVTEEPYPYKLGHEDAHTYWFDILHQQLTRLTH